MIKKFFIIVLIFAFALNTFLIKPRILNKNIDSEHISVYIPNGMANKYHDCMYFSFDDHRIWEYKLNKKEVRAIEEDLDNGIWKKATKEEYNSMIGSFYFDSDSDTHITEDIYYFLFDDISEEYIYAEPDGLPVIGHNELFIYDNAQKIYLCIALSI